MIWRRQRGNPWSDAQFVVMAPLKSLHNYLMKLSEPRVHFLEDVEVVSLDVSIIFPSKIRTTDVIKANNKSYYGTSSDKLMMRVLQTHPSAHLTN